MRAPGTLHVSGRAALDVGALFGVGEGPYGVDVVMVGHLLVPGLTERRPTSLSRRAITGLLRRDMGFDGVVITDALGMGAVARRWSNPEAARLALQAGAEHTAKDLLELETIAAIRGLLAGESPPWFERYKPGGRS